MCAMKSDHIHLYFPPSITPVPISSQQASSQFYVHVYLINHSVKLLLSVCGLVWGHPWEHGNPTSGNTLKNRMILPSPQMSVPSIFISKGECLD